MTGDRVFFVSGVLDPAAPRIAELEGVEITGFIASDGLTFERPPEPPLADVERLLRERYEPILSPEDYARLRAKAGLGAVIDGEVVEPPEPKQARPAPLMICNGGEMVLVTDPASYFGWGKRDGQADG